MFYWFNVRSFRFRVMLQTFLIIILISLMARSYSWLVLNNSRLARIDTFLECSAIWKRENFGSPDRKGDPIVDAFSRGVHVSDQYFLGLVSVEVDLIQNIEATIFNAEGQEVEADPKISSGVLQSNTKPFWGFSTDRNRRFVCVPISGGGSMALFGDLNGYYKDIYSRLILSILFFSVTSVVIWPIWWWLVSRALGNCEAIEKTAQLIIKDNRDVRIDLGAMDSEFVPMARNVNLMLDHVNQLHDTQARFISDASHELRTPIAGILNNAEVGHDDTIEEMREALGYCRESAKRMSRLVNNLLSLTGGEVFRDKPSQTVSVESLFFEAVDRIEPIATDARIELIISHPDVALYVRGDSDQLLQVLQNLLANAIQHSKSGDVVRLESCVVSEDGKWHIVMRVIDMGSGIDPRLGNRVFERFYRGRAEYDGSGLGLAICKVIIDRHGGTIAYRPNSPCGTIFEVKLDVPASLDCAYGSI